MSDTNGRPTAYEWRQGIDKRLDKIDVSIEKLRDEIKSDFRIQDSRFDKSEERINRMELLRDEIKSDFRIQDSRLDKSEERINRMELLVGRINMVYVGSGVLIALLVDIAIEKLF